MTKLNCVDLDKFVEEFGRLEQKVTEVTGKNSVLEITLEDANRLIKFNQSKEKSLTEEKESLLETVDGLQQALQEQCDLREENETLRSDLVALREDNKKAAEVHAAKLQQVLAQLKAEAERHQRALEAEWQRRRREVEDARREAVSQQEMRDAEVQKLLERKEADLEEMKRRMKEQEREKQSEILKLQMEFGVKLARVQSTSQWSQQQQQQQQGSHLLPQSVFKRKLQFFQEEKNKEIVCLRQRIRELEESQAVGSFNNNKRRKV